MASKAPDSVVCLISALAFHGITTQIPRAYTSQCLGKDMRGCVCDASGEDLSL